jgi:DNA anti-recombination protein RmuC
LKYFAGFNMKSLKLQDQGQSTAPDLIGQICPDHVPVVKTNYERLLRHDFPAAEAIRISTQCEDEIRYLQDCINQLKNSATAQQLEHSKSIAALKQEHSESIAALKQELQQQSESATTLQLTVTGLQEDIAKLKKSFDEELKEQRKEISDFLLQMKKDWKKKLCDTVDEF